MSFEADSLFDRRRLKRRLSFWRTLAIVVLVVAAVGAIQLAVGGDLPGLAPRAHLARLDVVGVIVEDRDQLEAIEEVAENPAAKALLVYIDSPGGTVVGGEALHGALRKVAAVKPVVAVMGTTAASAGYMVAIGADAVFARAGSLTGSIGVLMQTAEVTELLESLGIATTAIKSAPLKAVPSPLEPLTPEAREVTQALVDQVYDLFVGMVRERRQLEGDRLAEVIDGRVFTGTQALEKGLIDALGGEDEAREWLEREHGIDRDLPVRDIGPAKGFPSVLELAAALIGKKIIPERLRLDGLVAVWHPDLRF